SMARVPARAIVVSTKSIVRGRLSGFLAQFYLYVNVYESIYLHQKVFERFHSGSPGGRFHLGDGCPRPDGGRRPQVYRALTGSRSPHDRYGGSRADGWYRRSVGAAV